MGTSTKIDKLVRKSLFVLFAPVAAIAPINASHAFSSYPASVQTACGNMGRPMATPPDCAVCHVPPGQTTNLTAAGQAYKSSGSVTMICPAAAPTPTVKPTPSATPTATPTVRPTPSATPTATPTVRPTPSATPTATPTVRPTTTPTVMPTPPVVRPPHRGEREHEGIEREHASDDVGIESTSATTPVKRRRGRHDD